MMPAYVPPDARPTPTDVFDRPTVELLEPFVAEDRPTMVAPETTVAELVKATAAATPANPAVPRPRPPLARGEPRPDSTQKRPAVARPSPAPRDKPLKLPIDDVDQGFAAIEAQAGPPSSRGTLEVDLTGVRVLFGELATNHMRQLRDFVIELRWGPTPAAWVAVCEPSVESLTRAADQIEFVPLARGLRDLARAMHAVDVTTTTMIEGVHRERILAAHAALEAVLPDTFAIDGVRSQREAAILHALLSQIPDVHKVTIDKLYAAGLTTLETMMLANVEDLIATTRIPEVLAERIVERFRRYREEMASAAVDETRSGERAKIATLVDLLRRQNEAFEQAAAGWTEQAIQQKKDVLVARGQTMLTIDLELARLGEIALVRELERLPFGRKVLALDAFLTEANVRYAALPRSATTSKRSAPAEPGVRR
jgi:hypothetical protein